MFELCPNKERSIQCELKNVMTCRRSELHIAGNPLVGVYYRVYLDAAFLLSCLRMPPNSLENGIGEQRDGCGINDSNLHYS